MSQATRSAKPDEQPPRSIAEWVTFGVASVILAILVGLVGYTWLDKQQQQPPTFSIVRTDKIRETEGQFHVPFSVTNTGGTTAESVQIAAELKMGDEFEETAELQIDFLSGGEKEAGVLIFSRNPEQGQLTLRVTSYKLP